jgi:hypothetical protein
MKGEALMHWLSHLGEGRWSSFRGAASGILPPDSDAKRMLQFWRNRLSDLGHVDFFVDGSQRWRVRQTMLAGLCGIEGEAALCGARSPKIVQYLEAAAEKHGCRFVVNALPDLPSRIIVAGGDEQVEKVARECHLGYIARYSERLCYKLKPVAAAREVASDEPANWQVQSFDLESRRWVNERLPKSAREYESKHGELRYFWCDWQNKLRPAPKREAVYASAAVQRVALASYDCERRSLTMSAGVPLPEDYMRAACLCSGMPPLYDGGILLCESVPPAVASILLASAGQPHPGVPLSSPEDFKEGLRANGRSLQAVR